MTLESNNKRRRVARKTPTDEKWMKDFEIQNKMFLFPIENIAILFYK